ncbi:PREDICTED: uncharacterized protein LOC106628784 [Pseudopodoces humilis]|uniref:uncharacterized protein LOC106628784 n=1 Tax=Pseudopodoces humilis TaxID=181119 RepID=UPI0006B7CE09|nr:PREDICTED: uncharacterized protein LOC106628784 [Pseudopodoces humilis]
MQRSMQIYPLTAAAVEKGEIIRKATFGAGNPGESGIQTQKARITWETGAAVRTSWTSPGEGDVPASRRKMEALIKDWIIGRPRDAYAPVPEGGGKPPDNPKTSKTPEPVKPKRQRLLCVILLLGLVSSEQVLQPADVGWTTGRMWSVFLHKPGKDPGEVVQIIRLPVMTPEAIGPNLVVQAENPQSNSLYPLHKREASPQRSEATAFDSLYQMLDATFLPLNQSNPNATESCWLCYDTQPPYTDPLNNWPMWSNAEAPVQCHSESPSRRITISHMTG